MRRRRKPLQPETFPFLAVLLSAMGSLILILMILDRRARQVVLQRNQRAVADQQQRLKDEQTPPPTTNEDERKARLAAFIVRQKQLRAEEETLVAKRQAAEERIRASQQGLTEEQTRQRHMEQQLRAEQERLQAALRQAESQQNTLHHSDSATQQTQTQIQKLAAELAQAEEALKRLLEQKVREEQTWSIVPYVGKRGQNQRPLYVECAGSGFTFQSDKVALPGIDALTDRLRREIEMRTAQERKTRPGRDVYWMVLVRPDGIDNYYRFQAATRGLEVAFGYELIDADWALEFPEPPSDTTTVPLSTPRPVRGASDNVVSQGGTGGGQAATVLPPVGSGGHFPSGVKSGPPQTGSGERGAPGHNGGTETPGNPTPSGAASGTPPQPGSASPAPRPGGGTGTSAPSGPPPAGQGGEVGKTAAPGAGGEPGGAAEGGAGQGQEKGGKGEIGDGMPGPKKPKVLKPARVGPEPDWVIEVVCQGNRVTVPGGRITYTLAEVQANAAVLAERIAVWIRDRQATLRPGEPAYRPQIHFVVHADGQRLFHLVYPALERLQVPMRTVLHHEDEE